MNDVNLEFNETGFIKRHATVSEPPCTKCTTNGIKSKYSEVDTTWNTFRYSVTTNNNRKVDDPVVALCSFNRDLPYLPKTQGLSERLVPNRIVHDPKEANWAAA